MENMGVVFSVIRSSFWQHFLQGLVLLSELASQVRLLPEL